MITISDLPQEEQKALILQALERERDYWFRTSIELRKWLKGESRNEQAIEEADAKHAKLVVLVREHCPHEVLHEPPNIPEMWPPLFYRCERCSKAVS